MASRNLIRDLVSFFSLAQKQIYQAHINPGASTVRRYTESLEALSPSLSRKGGRLGPPLRTSNDHSIIVDGSVSTGN